MFCEMLCFFFCQMLSCFVKFYGVFFVMFCTYGPPYRSLQSVFIYISLSVPTFLETEIQKSVNQLKCSFNISNEMFNVTSNCGDNRANEFGVFIETHFSSAQAWLCITYLWNRIQTTIILKNFVLWKTQNSTKTFNKFHTCQEWVDFCDKGVLTKDIRRTITEINCRTVRNFVSLFLESSDWNHQASHRQMLQKPTSTNQFGGFLRETHSIRLL